MIQQLVERKLAADLPQTWLAMPDRPPDMVTFLATDIEQSTCRWEEQHDVVQRHLTSAQTHRGFRAAAMDSWRTAVATA